MRCASIVCPLLVAAALALPATAGAADRPWVEVRSPHFVVVSHAGDGAARDAAYQFEQVRSLFKALWPWARIESGRPFVVIVARDEKDLRALAPQYWEGRGFRPVAVFVNGADRDYVALRNDADRPDEQALNPYATAFEGLASVVLSASFPRDVPLWFRQGLQELMGNALIRRKDIHIGRVIPYHLDRLAEGPLFPMAALLGATRETLNLRDLSTRQLFDAQSWALVHYLMFGEKQANLPRVERFTALLLAGRRPGDATKEALGDLTALETGFRAYTDQHLFAYTQVNLDLDVSRESFAVRPLSAAEAAIARAGFLAAAERPVEARALLADARGQGSALAGAYETEALLLEAEDKSAEARAAYERAIALGSTSYYAHFRHAALAWPAEGGDFAPIVRDLEAATRLNPDFAPAHASLATARVQTRAVAAAIESGRKAVALDPRMSGHHAALARALANGGRRAEALQSVQRAIASAQDDSERDEATKLQAWIRLGATNN